MIKLSKLPLISSFIAYSFISWQRSLNLFLIEYSFPMIVPAFDVLFLLFSSSCHYGKNIQPQLRVYLCFYNNIIITLLVWLEKFAGLSSLIVISFFASASSYDSRPLSLAIFHLWTLFVINLQYFVFRRIWPSFYWS